MVPRLFFHLDFHEWNFFILERQVVFYLNQMLPSVLCMLKLLSCDWIYLTNLMPTYLFKLGDKINASLNLDLCCKVPQWSVFQVWIALSDPFLPCYPVGNIWNSTPWFRLYFFSSFDDSLYNQCIFDLNSLCFK